MSLRNQILSLSDCRVEPVEVPDWGVTLHVRTLTGSERAALMTKWKDAEKRGALTDLTTWVVVLTACEANGSRLFQDSDYEAVNAKSAQALDKVATAALRLNGLAPDSVEDAKKN